MKRKLIILLSVQRTGSTYLMDLLDEFSEIDCYGEVFSPKIDFDTPLDYQAYCVKTLAFDPRLLNANQIVFFEYMDFLLSSTSNTPCIKLMVDQALSLNFSEATWSNFDVKVIRLLRKNLLATHVSRVRSTLHGPEYTHAFNSLPNHVKVYLDGSKLLSDLNELRVANEYVTNMFSNLHSKIISYEELQFNLDQIVSDLGEFMGYCPPKNFAISRLKIGSKDVFQDILNADEIKEILSNSPFSYLLSC